MIIGWRFMFDLLDDWLKVSKDYKNCNVHTIYFGNSMRHFNLKYF